MRLSSQRTELLIKKVSVNMLLAGKFFQDGRVATVPTELIEDAKKIGAEDLFNKKKNLKDIV